MAQTDVVPKPPTSPRPPDTPPSSPADTPLDDPGVHRSFVDRFENAVEKLVRALEKGETGNKTENAKLEATKHVEAEKPRIRASKLEYKLVDEDNGTSKYKIVNLAAPPEEVTDLDEYMFVVRNRTEAHRIQLENDIDSNTKLKHFNLLVEYIRTAYISTLSRLASLLKNREITYDLL
ncbi:MAG: hypothetical protein Q9217_003574 [Psora testacea]